MHTHTLALARTHTPTRRMTAGCDAAAVVCARAMPCHSARHPPAHVQQWCAAAQTQQSRRDAALCSPFPFRPLRGAARCVGCGAASTASPNRHNLALLCGDGVCRKRTDAARCGRYVGSAFCVFSRSFTPLARASPAVCCLSCCCAAVCCSLSPFSWAQRAAALPLPSVRSLSRSLARRLLVRRIHPS